MYLCSRGAAKSHRDVNLGIDIVVILFYILFFNKLLVGKIEKNNVCDNLY